MKDKIYGKTVVLLKPVKAECWNFTDDLMHELPEGARVRVEHVNDETSTVVLLVDEKGEALGIELVRKDGVRQTGYRFIVGNEELGEATCLDVPARTRDVVAEMMAWEQGGLDEKKTLSLFRRLKADGILSGLQGCYGREASRLGVA